MNKFVFLFVALLGGCTYQMSLMPRDSGKIYSGQITSSGDGTGVLSVNIDGASYAGRFVKAASNDSFGFFQAYGKNGRTSTGYATSASMSASYKAILTSSEGKGLRCDVEGGDSGAGVCKDDAGRIFDLIYSR